MSKKFAVNDEEDYDEDFENFEEDDTISSPEKCISDPKLSKNISEVRKSEVADDKNSFKFKGTVTTMSVQEAADSKVFGVRRVKKFSSTDISFGKFCPSNDPRRKRLSRLFQCNIIDLNEDKSTILNLAPSTLNEVYNRLIRSQNPTIRQSGIPNDDMNRTTEMNTDDVVTSDKEVQFCYGDDTLLLRMTEIIDSKKINGLGSNRKISNIFQELSTFFMEDRIPDKLHNSRLSDFLKRSSVVCDSLLREDTIYSRNAMNTTPVEINSINKNIFSGNFLNLGSGKAIGSNELIRNRKCSSVRFSLLQPNLLISCHPYDALANDDLRPFKVLLSLHLLSNTYFRVSNITVGSELYLGHEFPGMSHMDFGMPWYSDVLLFFYFAIVCNRWWN